MSKISKAVELSNNPAHWYFKQVKFKTWTVQVISASLNEILKFRITNSFESAGISRFKCTQYKIQITNSELCVTEDLICA